MSSTRYVEEEKSKRSRTRSGCFTCRDRHMKCDEQLPVCQNCINSKRKCLRGIRLNFTQYTLYDPKDSWSDSPYASLAPVNYRILDQSIPVASLYKNGLQAYEHCRHLHSHSDLQDAQQSLSQDLRLNSSSSGFYMEQATANKPIEDANFNDLDSANFMANSSIGLPMDPWMFSQPLVDHTSFNFTEDTVLENFDIRNLLMNPLAVDTQLQEMKDFSANFDLQNRFAFPDSTPPKRHRTRIMAENTISPQDSDKLVSLLNTEKYFWLLDLFNELGIWKSSIPKYAARLAQTKDYKDGKSRARTHSYLLLECLLCCCKGSSMATIDSACRKQLDLWSKFNTKDVTTSSFKDFERVLISNVFIVQALLLKVLSPDFIVSKQFEMILATQGRLLHKLAARFQRISETKSRKLNGYVFTIASFQALVILRFFLQMHLQKLNVSGTLPITDSNHRIFNPLTLNLDASMLTEPNCDTGEFFTLSKLELTHLKRRFQGFDLNTGKYPSDSAKLRAQFWKLCFINNHHQTRGIRETAVSVAELVMETNTSSVLSPNDKCIALNIVSTYAKILQDPNSKVSSEPTFKQIQESLMTEDEKANWLSYFGWARHAP